MTSLSDGTFLTALTQERTKAKGKDQLRRELLEGVSHGDEILDMHNQLQGLADVLADKVDNRLTTNEDAFFSAYKKFMHSVRKEFKGLREKADAQMTQNRRDDTIKNLTQQLQWFMTEALRLGEHCKRYKQELDKWKGKAEALEGDRRFLEDQIKNAKKSNKSLRGAVEKAQTDAYSALVAGEEGNAGGVMVPASPEHSTLAIEDTGSGLSVELEKRYQDAVKSLKAQLDAEQRKTAKLRSISDQQFNEPSELEAFFVECVEKVRSEIRERRRATAAHNQKLQAAPKRSRSVGAISPASTSGSGSNGTLLNDVSLEDFTNADRRRVITELLSSDKVLHFLYDRLYPPMTEQPHAIRHDAAMVGLGF